jgi:hypothetical protein
VELSLKVGGLSPKPAANPQAMAGLQASRDRVAKLASGDQGSAVVALVPKVHIRAAMGFAMSGLPANRVPTSLLSPAFGMIAFVRRVPRDSSPIGTTKAIACRTTAKLLKW